MTAMPSEVHYRQCAKCLVIKPIEDFHVEYRATGARLKWCRSCMAEAKHAWYLRNTQHQKDRVRANSARTTRENLERAWTYLSSHACVDCGETDPIVLQFDHVTGVKRTSLAQMVRSGFHWESIEVEIAKCVVRCGNCHRRKTAKEQGYHDAKHSHLKLEDAAGVYTTFDN